MRLRRFAKLRRILFVILLIFFGLWLNNNSLLVDRSHAKMTFLAHRGLAQTFDLEGVEWNTDTSKIIHEPEHLYLENTLESMRAAFEAGADIIEFDVRVTQDNQLAVFHDYELSFRTNGTGLVSDYTMDELKTLDIGYGYTADNGETFPFRGKFVGQMPSIDEVFTAFPDGEFLIDIKDSDILAARLLDEQFRNMPPERLAQISISGNRETIEYLIEKYPDMKHIYRSKLQQGLVDYMLVGWTGYVPENLHNMHLHIPLTYARFLWGWPNRFLERMESVNSRVVIVDGDGSWSDGFDTFEQIENLPPNFTGTIWTERIDLINSETLAKQ